MRRNLQVPASSAVDWRTFEEVVTEYLDELYGTALRLNRGRSVDAEDLLQDAMLRACKSYGGLRDPGAVRGWLFTILTRTHLNRQRTATRRAEQLASDMTELEFERALESWPTDGRSASDSWPSPDDVGAAIDDLDDSLRSVVVLADLRGFRQREVAKMVGLPEGTVASRLYRARRVLRDSLADASSAAHRRRDLA
jgi:RNA polymerase sigma-70 factor (ECF subfamily)